MMYEELQREVIEYAGADKARPFNNEEYARIEYVYVWHPAIRSQGGKRQIAILWQEFGMGVINDMTPVAKEFEALDRHRAKIREDLADVEKDISILLHHYR